jgi:hypothetical protein
MGETIPQIVLADMKSRLNAYGLENSVFVKRTKVNLHQPNNNSEELEGKIEKLRADFYENSYEKNVELMEQQKMEIFRLTSLLKKMNAKQIPILQIKKEIVINYPDIEKVAYAELIETNEDKLDTVSTFFVNWKNTEKKKETEERLGEWLKERLGNKKISIKPYE